MCRQPFFAAIVLAGGLILLAPIAAWSTSLPAHVPLPVAADTADVIVVGKVTTIEEQSVMAPPFKGATTKVEYRIAVIKIDENLKGAKGLTHIRIAFQPPPPPLKPIEPKSSGPIAIGPAPFPRNGLVVDNAGCFLVKKLGDETFYRFVDGNYNDYIVKDNREYDKKFSLVKRVLKLMEQPDTSLKSKDAADRLLTAYLLLHRYQANAGPKATTESIDAEQSKLILEAIAGADWSKTEPSDDQITPRGVFQSLRLTPKDNWNAPQQASNQDIRVFLKGWDTAAQKWLKDNTATYRVQRWVPEKTEK